MTRIRENSFPEGGARRLARMPPADDPALLLRSAAPMDLAMILRGERLYLQQIEPENEARWTAALSNTLRPRARISR